MPVEVRNKKRPGQNEERDEVVVGEKRGKRTELRSGSGGTGQDSTEVRGQQSG